MPNYFVDNKDRWMALAESESDFAVLFIRSWIPFNAWYCNNYPQHNKKDAPILKELKNDSNLFRTRLIALLSGSHVDSLNFRTMLGNLHRLLEDNYIPDPAKRVTFTNLHFRDNPMYLSKSDKPYKKLHYKVERFVGGNVNAIVVNSENSQIKFNYSHNKYDLEHFRVQVKADLTSSEQRRVIETYFKEIDPKRSENLISGSKAGQIDCGGIYFINDPELLSQAVLELLYRLRCILFHGEIQPSKDNLSVYEPAYYMLRLLLKSLK